MGTVTKPIVTDETAQEMLAELKKITNAVKRITLTITMKTVNDTPVTDEKVVVTNTATGTVLARVDYAGQPVTVEVNQDTEYAVTGTQNSINTTGFYAPSTVTGIAQSDTNITIEYLEVSDMSSLEAVRIAIAQHPGEELLPVGTDVTISLLDGTTRKFRLVHYQYVTLRDGTRKWAGILFHSGRAMGPGAWYAAPETEVATEEYATSNLTYYGRNGTTYTMLNLKNGDPVPYDDYDEIYHNEIADSSCAIVKTGASTWAWSYARDCLNSDAAEKGGWYQQHHIGQVKVDWANTLAGFWAQTREVDKNAIAEIKVESYNPYTSEFDVTYDKTWAPSVTQMFGVPSSDYPDANTDEPFSMLRQLGMVLPTNTDGSIRRPPNFGFDNGYVGSMFLRSIGNKYQVWNWGTGEYTNSLKVKDQAGGVRSTVSNTPIVSGEIAVAACIALC